jgi:hypothetical protein
MGLILVFTGTGATTPRQDPCFALLQPMTPCQR